MPSVADILLEEGRNAARARELSGQIWGGAVSDAFRAPGQILEQHQRDIQQQQENQDRATMRRIQQATLEERQAERADRLRQIEEDKRGEALTTQAVGQFRTQNPETGYEEPDHGKIVDFLLQNGARKHAKLYMDFAKSHADMLNDVQDTHIKGELKKNELWAGALKPIVDAPEDQRPTVYGAIRSSLSPYLQHDPFFQQWPAEYPGPDTVKALYNSRLTEQQQWQRQEDAAKKAREARSDRRAEFKEVPGVGLVDIGPALAETPGAPKTLVPAVPKEATPPHVGSFEDYVARIAAEQHKDPKALTTKDIDAARKRYHEDVVKPVVVMPGGSGALTDEGVDYAATIQRVTGHMPPLGMGNAQARAAIINRAAAQVRALGQSPAAAVQKQAAFTADAASLKKMRTMSAAAEAFEYKAVAQTEIIKDLSTKVPRTKWPIINDALQAGRTRIEGDEAATKLANAVETFTEEYAKVMSGTTGSAAASTDSTRAASKRLINTGMNQGTMTGVLDLMKKEMRLTMDGYGAVVDHITTRMGGAPSEESSTTVEWTRDANGNPIPKPR